MNTITKSLFVNSFLSKIQARQVHANADILNGCTKIVNRNPRNLELLRIARKPAGYHLEKPGRDFWHQLLVRVKSRYVVVELHHCINGSVISASTGEWAMKKQLYSLQDSSAYINLGRMMARRCLESGIYALKCNLKPTKGGKIELLLTELTNAGISLEEPTRYKYPAPWDLYRYEKPWEVHE